MNNLQQPAFPTIESINHSGDVIEVKTKDPGFTKLEYAAILIAQGLLGHYNQGATHDDFVNISVLSAKLAKMVIEECNK